MSIPPPVPAPYLADVTSLPNGMLGKVDGRCASLPRDEERLFEASVAALRDTFDILVKSGSGKTAL
ncbi:MAG: hypothetical protein QM811_16710 [Pirellulales bacterium]